MIFICIYMVFIWYLFNDIHINIKIREYVHNILRLYCILLTYYMGINDISLLPLLVMNYS